MAWRSNYSTSWRIDQPVDQVWRLLADTERLNEAVGVPRQKMEETALPDGDVERIARMKAGPVEMEWIERPYEWVAARWFRRDLPAFRRGPFKSMWSEMTLRADGDGTLIEYEVHGVFSGLAGLFLLATGYLRKSANKVAAFTKKAVESSGGGEAAFGDLGSTAAVDRDRLDRLVKKLGLSEFSHGLAPRLAALIGTAMEVDVDPIRPRRLARQWDVPERQAVELCLAAVEAGLLDMSWDILCPRCRGAKASSESLAELQRGVHCPSCNIDYGAEFSRNVEVTFRPNPAVRRLDMGAYCLSGPMTTPHVKVQLFVAPGDKRKEAAVLPAGHYRVRTIEPGPAADVAFSGGAFPHIRLADDRIDLESAGLPDTITLENSGSRARTVVIESREWAEDALSGHEATTFQAFRDLFPNQVLERGSNIRVESVSLMFTDIRGSTALYERVGDGAPTRSCGTILSSWSAPSGSTTGRSSRPSATRSWLVSRRRRTRCGRRWRRRPGGGRSASYRKRSC